MNYSEKIKYLREQMLLTQDELSKILGVNSITICRWETGKCEPNMKAKKAIRDYCLQNGVVLDEFLLKQAEKTNG